MINDTTLMTTVYARSGSFRVTSIAMRYVKYISPSILTGRAPLKSSTRVPLDHRKSLRRALR